MISRFLIIYSTQYGQTEKIAKFIGHELDSLGHIVNFMNLNSNPLKIDFNQYDAFIVGAPIYSRAFPKSIKKWVTYHAT